MNKSSLSKKPRWASLALVVLGILLLQTEACVHPPVMPSDLLPNDSVPVDTIPQDTIPQDTIPQDTIPFHPCDPDSVYFERDLLPILVSNCALSGCHDAQSAQDGVILDSYINVLSTGDIKAGDPGDSDLYEVLVDNDPGDRMPPAPADPLPQAQIDLVFKWISQGAQNLSCEDSVGNSCDTTQVQFAGFVAPLIQTHCQGCHSGTNPGGGVLLTNHATIAAAGNNGRLYGAMAHLQGYSPMPQGTDKRPDCELAQLKAWINAGTPDN